MNPGTLLRLSADTVFTACLQAPGSEGLMSGLEPEKLGGSDGPKGKVLARRFPPGLSLRDGYQKMVYFTSATVTASPVGNYYFW